MPQAVYELRYDNGAADAYHIIGTDSKAICSTSFLGRGNERPAHIQVTVSTTALLGEEVKTVTIVKTHGSWGWRMPKAKFPVIVYPEAEQLFNSFYPNAVDGNEFNIWLKVEVLSP